MKLDGLDEARNYLAQLGMNTDIDDETLKGIVGKINAGEALSADELALLRKGVPMISDSHCC